MCIRNLFNRIEYAINGLGFKITALVVLLFCMANTLRGAIYNFQHDSSVGIAAKESYLINEYSFLALPFRLVALFIVVLPFGFSFFNEKTNGEKYILQMRYGNRNYYILNSLACFITTFLAFLIPFTIEFVINNIVFSNKGISLGFSMRYSYNYNAFITGQSSPGSYNAGMQFADLYLKHPYIYAYFYMLMFSAVMALLATFAHSVSLMIKKYALLIFAPVYLIDVLQKKIELVINDITSGIYIQPRIIYYVTLEWTQGIHWGYFIVFCLSLLSMIVFNIFFTIRKSVRIC